MPFENEFIDSLAREGDPESDGFMRIGQTQKDGKPHGNVYLSPHRRLGAVVTAESIYLKRHLGRMPRHAEHGVHVPRKVWPALLSALKHWEASRDNWWAIYDTTSGYPGGIGGAQIVQEPGKDSEKVKVYENVMGNRRGKQVIGKEERRPLAKAASVGEGVQVIAEVYWIGREEARDRERHVGLVYDLGYGLEIEAVRHDARLELAGNSVWIENYEAAFLRNIS